MNDLELCLQIEVMCTIAGVPLRHILPEWNFSVFVLVNKRSRLKICRDWRGGEVSDGVWQNVTGEVEGVLQHLMSCLWKILWHFLSQLTALGFEERLLIRLLTYIIKCLSRRAKYQLIVLICEQHYAWNSRSNSGRLNCRTSWHGWIAGWTELRQD